MIFEKIRERLEDAKDSVPVNRLLDNIIKDKPKELGQLMAYDNAIDIINQVETEYNNGWIPCSERLPKYDEYVLCQGKNSQFIACIDSLDNKWRDNGFRVRINITYWQPLPHPPKGE